MNPVTIRYAFRPVRRSLATGQVADQFGLADGETEHIVAEGLDLDIRPSDLVLFTGPSGSGKSSLLRAAGEQLGAVDAMTLALPEAPLVDAVPGSVEDRVKLLAGCGLSEARLLLRTPAELSDGERYRFRLAYAFACGSPRDEGRWIMADEFAANLDRTLAKVVSFNLRKLATRTGAGMLLATTHDDLIEDLQPDLHVRCRGDGEIETDRHCHRGESRAVSFASELAVEDGSLADWPRFAKWHYRSDRLCFVRRVALLKHGPEPIGICVFTAPAASLAVRTRYFGLNDPRTRIALTALNEQLWLLSRLVIQPTYRGAGIASRFVRRACQTCPVPWIETLSVMGNANPVFERAGFVRAGVVRKPGDGKGYGGQYGPRGKTNAATQRKSCWSEPIYCVFDNRREHITRPTPVVPPVVSRRGARRRFSASP